jgi:hypothetical protein
VQSNPRGDDGATETRREFLTRLARSTTVAVGAFALGYATDDLWARLVRGFRLEREDYPKAVVAGWRVHHNVVGYLLVVAGTLWRPILLIPAGLGVIVGHRRRDRLWWFVERGG